MNYVLKLKRKRFSVAIKAKIFKIAKTNIDSIKSKNPTNLKALLSSRLEKALKTVKLKKFDVASILIPDRTRPLSSKRVLSTAIRMLRQIGFKKIQLIIAYGNHLKHPVKYLGLREAIFKNVVFVHHKSNLKKNLFKVHDGDTKARREFKKYLKNILGPNPKKSLSFISKDEINALAVEFKRRSAEPVYINKSFAESDIKIVLSDIKPHQIFGYSGGPKMILPGIADSNTIINNHMMRITESSKLGNVTGNLPRSESHEVAGGIKNVVFINTISSSKKKIIAFDISTDADDYFEFVRKSKKYFEKKLPKFDTVISVGLSPIDINLYQLTKAVTPAAISLNKNGKIIIVADIKEDTRDYNTINSRIYKLTIKKELPGGNEKVYLFSNLKKNEIRKTFMIPIDKKKFRKMISSEKKSLLVIEDGDLLVPKS